MLSEEFYIRGFLLGLAIGVVCFSYCGSVLIPYLLSEGRNVRRNFLTIFNFLVGRLAGYVLFAMMAYLTGLIFLQNLMQRKLVLSIIYILLALLLIYYGFRNRTVHCAAKSIRTLEKKIALRGWLTIPIVLGFLTGLNLCPPFLLAFTEAAEMDSLLKSIMFFVAFFVGTSVYLLALPALGVFKRYENLKYIGRLAAGILGIYYLFFGIITLSRS